MNYTIKNDILKVTLADDGAQLLSVIKNETNKEYIWNGDAKYWNRHAPILFPIVGALKNKQYTYQNIIYNMSNHGFARDSKFELVEKSDNKVEFVLVSNDDIKKIYPFDFELHYSYEIIDNTLKVGCSVINKGNDKMYFSIGAHPAFLCNVESEKCNFLFDKKDKFEYKLLSKDGLLEDKIYTQQLDNGKLSIVPKMFDNDALVIENNQIQEVSLLDETGKQYVKVKFDEPVLGLWSPARKNAPFVCIEPWYGRCDRVDSDGNFVTKDWIKCLEESEKFSSKYFIEIR